MSAPAEPSSLPPFPRPVHTFVGREAERRRMLELIERETLFLVYGVGGIGKSELVYKVIEDARQHPRWREREPILIAVRPQMPVEHVLAMLRVGTDVRRRVLDIQSSPSATFEDDLAEAARALDAAPTLVFLDDVHHLDGARTSQMLGYLSRHVRASRLVVASRLEVPLPPGTPVPVVTRLSPLDEGDTASMVVQLARTLEIDAPDVSGIFDRSGGSPFYVQRELAGDTLGGGEAEGGLEQTLRELEPMVRRYLLTASVARGRIGVTELTEVTEAERGLVVGDLSRRFLVDVSREMVMVHDLVREALVRVVADAELFDAHRRAATLHLRRFEVAPEAAVMDAVEAIHQLVKARAMEDAWAAIESLYRPIAAGGLDHLLLDELRELHPPLPKLRTSIDLLVARILVRRSLIAEAQEVLRRVGRRPVARDSQRYLLLMGEVEQRLGHLRRAEALFRRAQALAEDPAGRFQAGVQLADVNSLRGANGEARRILAGVLAEHPAPSRRDRGRWGWSQSLSYIIEEDFEPGVAAAREAAAGLDPARHGDLLVMLAMLEVVGRVELDEIGAARALVDRVMSRAASAGALREYALSLYTGMVLHAEGELRRARVALQSSFDYFSGHSDYVMASIAGHYLGLTMLDQGEIEGAIDMFGRMSELATAAELGTLAPHGVASLAEAVLHAGKVDEARKLAEQALAAERIAPEGAWIARTTLARIRATAGDLAGARAALEEAIARTPDYARRHYQVAADIERAAIELMGGSPERVIESADRARRHYASCGRTYREARACAALAAGYVARGSEADLIAAEAPLARAESLAAVNDYPRVAGRVALVRAALARRAHRPERAREYLIGALRALGAVAGRPEVMALRAALAPADEAASAPGVGAMLALLGISVGPRYAITDRLGERLVSEHELAAERAQHELVVEPARALITAAGGAREDRGRPVACELLARLVEGRGAVLGAEALFRDVWNGREYHPLRHRNTVYVGVKRLRQTLRRLLGDRDVIETASGGWRIADHVDAISVRPAE